jgi:hypothetical protein
MATEFTRGHLSAKLVKVVNGNECWEEYDTRNETDDPVVGTIMVFNSETGVYEPCDCLSDAVELFAEHETRLTPLETPQQIELKEKREELKEEGKLLRNLIPFNVSPGEWS